MEIIKEGGVDELDKPIVRENISMAEWRNILDDALAGLRADLRGIHYSEPKTARELGEMFAHHLARQCLVN
jgi:hypothetical protein